MKLSQLRGNVLKVYLVLVEQRGAGDYCPRALPYLIRQTRLSRHGVRQALSHLESRGLIVPQRQGWWVRTEPLEWLLPPWRDETEANDVPAPAGMWN
jgi:predicted transcriptional regulator